LYFFSLEKDFNEKSKMLAAKNCLTRFVDIKNHSSQNKKKAPRSNSCRGKPLNKKSQLVNEIIKNTVV